MNNFLNKKYNIKIRHSYLEKGHTQNEGDSIHSLRERSSKNNPVYVPDQWYTLVGTVKRSSPPYEVKEILELPEINTYADNTLKGSQIIRKYVKQMQRYSFDDEEIERLSKLCRDELQVMNIEKSPSRAILLETNYEIIYLAKQGIYSLGPIRPNRLPNCKLPDEKQMKKEERDQAISFDDAIDRLRNTFGVKTSPYKIYREILEHEQDDLTPTDISICVVGELHCTSTEASGGDNQGCRYKRSVGETFGDKIPRSGRRRTEAENQLRGACRDIKRNYKRQLD
ncbi:hypothetical protein ILUMI_06572 [Ignelater luminosus]|uniref:Uncharacterized protein n=1 Tax=Ignelater luminosus TaxID=2038154 RepID=A0A8K0DF87_IGNLU|nr:hypothetical protein ILUMI_06572 [Ignelater luminosus]